MRRREDRREEDGPTCAWLLVILAALVLGELLWVVLFTGIALWLREL